MLSVLVESMPRRIKTLLVSIQNEVKTFTF